MPSLNHEKQVSRMDAICQKNGHHTERNVAIWPGRDTGYGDLLARDAYGNVLLIEYEMDSPKRVSCDVQKRRALNEDAVLWIVCPTLRLTRMCRKRLRSLNVDPSEPILVLPLYMALWRLESCVSFRSLVVGQKYKTKQKS